jgi:hypothetical protein
MSAVASGEVATDFYTYSVAFSDLLQATAQTSSIQIEADSDFEIIKLSAYSIYDTTEATIANLEQNQFPFSVMLTDTGSGRNLMSQAVAVPALFGTAQLPFILPKTKLIYARSVLAVTITNLSSALDFDYVQLCFHGRKIFSQS